MILITSLFNKKAKLWIRGRKDIFERLRAAIPAGESVIWMHCASLGEFEQGRPVLEKLKDEYPSYKILLTFFSPSGYEVRKNYEGADWVFYLPLDTKTNAQKFINIANPKLVIFVKYEYWYHYLHELYQRQIPTILISAIFREHAVFFKWYGSVHRKMLTFFSHIFVQTKESYNRVQKIVPTHKITLAGDTRFDRVASIASQFDAIPAIEKFIANNKKVIVAGSTWPDDEIMLNKLLLKNNDLSLIIAPHEINSGHIEFLKSTFTNAILFSNWKEWAKNDNVIATSGVLIIDNIGMLSKLYKYSNISYIGGGFNKSGIHNTLEAAVYGKPVIFGPNYSKFAEAINLIKSKGGFSYSGEKELFNIFESLISNHTILKEYSNNAQKFVTENTGATNKITNWLRQISFE
ncbi:3-deoxy-D-manno-octulosonic acid transferase [Niabella ginsengisoli]|uniref:3-deoxy-D-manno-octulosonic acid transferase n=1 Tax=Niabella ginsengisoli TaxID=522298 RepID=A0ABS9SL28_9BACT|nr:glycosyltransferase N-terminal domain-containing protein [Niabella ginsengisoli]MCH5599086.1 3-deoxy-D-manno-octulosonic acid transferase [Niabella ginsengisoli]